MIARYKMASCETIIEHTNGNALNSKQVRVDKATLTLEAYKMPMVWATGTIVVGRISTLSEDLQNHWAAIRNVRVYNDNDPLSNCYEAEYLTARCPHCEHKNKLEHNRWLVSIDSNSNKAFVTHVHTRKTDTHQLFASYPIDWMPFADESLVPLSECNEPLDHPSNSLTAENFIESCFQAASLSKIAKEESNQTMVLGRTSGFQGIYSCAYCQNVFYVVYEPEKTCRTYMADRFLFEDFSVNTKTPIEISTTITSSKSSIDVEFSPPVRGAFRAIESIKFDLNNGFTIIDGVQLMKENDSTRFHFLALPLGFECPELIKHLSGLLSEANNSVNHIVSQLKLNLNDARLINHSESLAGFAGLAIANRLRGYPDSLYENVLDLRGLRILEQNPKYMKSWIRKFDALPIRYEDIEKAYVLSGLPNIKSIRRVAFEQPLIIPIAKNLERMPFEDPNILRSFLGHKRAIQVLEELTIGHEETTALSCLIATKGELATWKYLKRIIDIDEFYYSICCGGSRSALTPEIMKLASTLKIQHAAKLIIHALNSYDLSEIRITEAISHSLPMSNLEGIYAGHKFYLPETGLDLVVAGAEMHNCLADYCNSYENKTSRVLLIKDANRLVGAVEINKDGTTIVQAKAQHNEPLESYAPLQKAFLAWMKANNLKYHSSICAA